MQKHTIGQMVRASVSFLAFQGSRPDTVLMMDVHRALDNIMKYKKYTTINWIHFKIINEYKASNDFSYIKADQLRFVCSILLYLFSQFYKSKKNKYGDELKKLIEMLIDGPTRKDIDDMLSTLNLSFYYDEEVMAYYTKCLDILKMTPEQFSTATMHQMGFAVDSDSE
jgi:hypothetical protein